MVNSVSIVPVSVSSCCLRGKYSWCPLKNKPCTCFYFPSLGICPNGGAL